MSEIELKERKPTWDYMLNDLAFSSLKTRVLYGIFDNQDRFDFEYQIELKDKEIERLNNIINKIEEHFVFLKMNSTGGNKEFFEDILDFIKALKELKGSD